MIIRMTICDNDFTEKYLTKFAKNLQSKLLGLCDIICRDENLTIDAKLDAHEDWERTFKLLNPNCTNARNFTDADETFICDQVKKCWINYITQNISKTDAEDDGLNYFIHNFICRASFAFYDKWENGEAVYYFTNGNNVICQ